jgi:hypothetical protein
MTIFTDSGTIPSVTGVTSNEISQFVDPVRATSRTKVSALDTGPIKDIATVITITTPSYEEFFVHPSGYWGSFDTDDGII